VADDGIVIPALLRAARGAYSKSIRRYLAADGLEDVPVDGPWVLGGMTNHGGSAADMLGGLDVSAARKAQLVDTLVLRGYLQRVPDSGDPTRVELALTLRGAAAGRAVARGIAAVDELLADRITPAELAGLRTGLFALAMIKEDFGAGSAQDA
jgi:DNA-binding MarR family transcriptional regulator